MDRAHGRHEGNIFHTRGLQAARGSSLCCPPAFNKETRLTSSKSAPFLQLLAETSISTEKCFVQRSHLRDIHPHIFKLVEPSLSLSSESLNRSEHFLTPSSCCLCSLSSSFIMPESTHNAFAFFSSPPFLCTLCENLIER